MDVTYALMTAVLRHKQPVRSDRPSKSNVRQRTCCSVYSLFSASPHQSDCPNTQSTKIKPEPSNCRLHVHAFPKPHKHVGSDPARSGCLWPYGRPLCSCTASPRSPQPGCASLQVRVPCCPAARQRLHCPALPAASAPAHQTCCKSTCPLELSEQSRDVSVCREGDNLSENIQEAASHKQGKVTDTKLSPEQLEEV
jgi:hypothetical protein